MSLSKKHTNEAQEAQARADYIARVNREQREWENEQEDATEFAKRHNLNTVEDHINYIKSTLLGFGKKKTGKKVVPMVGKKKCINCGGTNILRQRDETLKTLVWIGYECFSCGEKGMII